MQTTLLGLGIALILAIVAALVAPLVVDWNHYRSAFETEASRLTGLSVHVHGTIEARILPTPLITLGNVEAGEAGQAPSLRAGKLELEVGLGPLLRGEIQASKARLVEPQISIGLDRSGAIDWPAAAPSFRPQALSVSGFDIEDGSVTLTDAVSGSRLTLQKLSFKGDIQSLLGPFSGEGAFVVGTEPYSYRVSGGHGDGDSGLRIRLGIDPTNHPLTTDIDGTLTIERGRPHFTGTLALMRPAGAALSSGQRVMNDPWHLVGKIQATPAAATLQDIAFQYGPDESPLNFSGRAKLTLGAKPHLEGAVSAMQLDVDRALADPDLTHRPPLLVIKSFLTAFVAAVKLPLPADIGVGVDAVTVGGTAIQSLHGTMRFDGAGWSLDDFEFRAPGSTQVEVSGRLDGTPSGFAFSGPATLDSFDFDLLLAWLRGEIEQPSGEAKALNAHGDIAIAGDRVAVDHLAASLDRDNLEGRFSYSWAAAAHPATLDAELHAATLDLDSLAAFGKAAADYGLKVPAAGSLVLDIGNATSAGIDVRGINARVTFDAGALQIDRLSIAELGGAALDIGGRIDELSSHPRGQVTFDLDASALDGLIDAVGKFAPRTAGSLRGFADRLAPAKLHAVLDVEPAAAAGSSATLDLAGQLGLMRVSLKGEATGTPSRLDEANVRINGRLDADDGSMLAALLDLDHVVGVDQLPGSVTLAAAGPLNGDLHLDGRVATSGFAAALAGTLRWQGDKAPTGAFQVQASAADLGPLAQAMTGQPGAAAPLSAHAAVVVAGSDLSFTQIAGTLGKASLRGRFNIDLAGSRTFDGEVDADEADATRVAALLLGLPRAVPDSNAIWSSQPLGVGAFTGMNGAMTVRVDRADLTPTLVAHDLTGVLHFHPAEIALDGLGGSLAGGRLTGDLAFHRNADMLDAQGNIALAGADAAGLLGFDRQAIDGKLTLGLTYDGIGASPIEIVHSLDGNGTITVADAHIAGLDPSAFDAAMRAADQSDTIDPTKIQAAVNTAMANRTLVVPQGNAKATMTGGKLGVVDATLAAQDGADLSLSGDLDLASAVIDLRATLRGQATAKALIRTPPGLAVALKGPLAAPQESLDTSALTSWLTLRAAELQARRLELIEASQRADVVGAVSRPDSPAIQHVPVGMLQETALPATASAAPPPPPPAPRLDRTTSQPIAPRAIIVPPRPDANAAVAERKLPAPPPSPSRPVAPRSPFDFLFRLQN